METFSKKIQYWFAKFQKYKVGYKGGFFYLSNLTNSPFTIIESFNSVPFCKHDREQKLLTANTMFIDAQLYYAELEKGLWLFVFDLYFKKNVAMKYVYDESLPIDFNFVNLHYNTKKMLINGMVLRDKTWSIFKAGSAALEFHFKDTREKNITIYFTNEWLAAQNQAVKPFNNANFQRFFESDNTYFLSPNKNVENEMLYEQFLNLMIRNGDASENKELTKLSTDFFKKFMENSMQEEMDEIHYKISDRDRKRIQEAQKYLFDNLSAPFPGIETIAKKVGLSPTKLKSDFKMVFGKTIFQYFRDKQMESAVNLLKGEKHTVKEVANIFGYTNVSKFSTAFKKHKGVLPSKYTVTH